MTLEIKGKEYPVSAKFRATVLAHHPDLAATPFGNLEAQAKALLDLSTARNTYQAPQLGPDEEADFTGNLTKAEAHLLANIMHTINCHKAVNFLQGRSHEDFGFEGIDQVHGVRISTPCGCQITHVYDYWHGRGELQTQAVKEDKPVVLHPHYSKRWCDKHREHGRDFRAHHAAVYADPVNTPKAEKDA